MQMFPPRLFPRFVRAQIERELTDTPVVLIHGPRQSGKSTLALAVGHANGYDYLSFDDYNTLRAAREDPVSFVQRLSDRVILDEIQRVPEIFATIKIAVDSERVPGRFILTGSANILQLPQLSDSLAGRIAIVRLSPLSQTEIEEQPFDFITAIFSGQPSILTLDTGGTGLLDRIVAGGYPSALIRRDPIRRAEWYRHYVETLIERDIRDISRIRSLHTLPRLLRLVAGDTATILNVSELAGELGPSRPTIEEYLLLLQRIFLWDEIPAWRTNRRKRLTARSKAHIADTGLGCALLDVGTDGLLRDDRLRGRMVESFVWQELSKQAAWSSTPVSFYHFRDQKKKEVDLVLEGRDGTVVGVEVKSGGTVNDSDLVGLRALKRAAGSKFLHGVVLYDGNAILPHSRDMTSIPISALWKGM